ncbi:glutamine-rich protein 2 isoform X2 [Astyanax mexicanus]|uniref:glutamine-rich protein 2 isoform X2 n=1 Tax=Astyanax mexicanus TaxID=7994 RepID=UPI0020CAF8C8|nr:glutamine-rich protein 2 isoform X2 [Astyanax mexicanus]
MSGDISLFDLVNASIGTPEPGAVNFSALHALLHAMLEHLNIQDVSAVWKDSDAGRGPGESPLSAGCPQNPYRGMQDKLQHIEQQLAALERLPSGSELLAGSGSVNDVWQLLQLRRRVEGSEDGVTRCVALIQDLLVEIKELKKSRDSLKKEVENLQIQFNQINMEQLFDKFAAVEQCLHHVEELKSATNELKEKVTLFPEPDEFTQCVTWEVMQAALVSERQKTMKELKDSITGTGLSRPTLNIALTRRDSSAVGLPGLSESAVSASPVLGSSHIPSSQQGLLDLVSERDLPLLSRVSSGAQHYPETLEALRNVGRLQEKHESLEARVKCLEGGKADHAQVQQLRELLSDMGERDMPENIQEQLNHLNTLMETVIADRDKVTEMESLIMGTEREMSVSESSELRTEGTESSSSAPQQQPQDLQIFYFRNAMQKLGEEVQKLKQDIAAVNLAQKRSTDKQKQDQLDHPQPTLEEVKSPPSAVVPVVPGSLQHESAELDQSVQEQAAAQVQGQSRSQSEGQGGLSGQGGQAGPCSVDLGRKTSELASDVQSTILCLQSECEQIHITTTHLQEDQSQKQRRIDYLYKAVEELDKKKADREVVEMKIGIKADKQALESKVSRTQFDTKTEQLNGMFEELLGRVTCQEQDWNKFIDKISTEMESKLDRIELEPLKQQLEDRWRSIRKQLQTQPAPEYDEAAGFRKQLVARFNCISCDRPVDMMTPGQHLLTVPSAPGFPCHKSNRPYTVYELEQVRQPKRSIAQIRQNSSEMCRWTDRVQNKFDSSQRDTSQSSLFPPISLPLLRTSQSLPQHERIPEMASYGYLTMSRSCGGNHTLTYANRRYSHLQHITQLIQTEEDSEVDILGVDGHIYKGRVKTRAVKTVESRLPTISSKEGSCKSRDRGSRCQTQKCSGAEPGRRSPLRPQSAKTQGSRSASSSSVKGRPVTSMDCLSQPVAPQSSADPNSELLQGGDILRGFSQSQNTPVTSL